MAAKTLKKKTQVPATPTPPTQLSLSTGDEAAHQGDWFAFYLMGGCALLILGMMLWNLWSAFLR